MLVVRASRSPTPLTMCSRPHPRRLLLHARHKITGDVPPQPFLDTRREPDPRSASRAPSCCVGPSAGCRTRRPGPRTPSTGRSGGPTSGPDRAIGDRRLLDGAEATSRSCGGSAPSPASTQTTSTRSLDFQRTSSSRRSTSDRQPLLPAAELSELLANAGILPMFGFPTRVRALYDDRIKSRETTSRTIGERPGARPGDRQLLTRRRGRPTRDGIHTCVGLRRLRRARRPGHLRRPDRRADPPRRCTVCAATTVSALT